MAKRGPVPRISREQVLDVARQLPAERLTMSAISAELGVTVGALYRYFPDKASVIASLAQEVVALIEPPDPSLPWRDWLLEAALVQRRMWSEHPELVDLRTRVALARPGWRLLQVAFDVLDRAGFDREDALFGFSAIAHLAFSFGIDERVLADSPPDGVDEWMSSSNADQETFEWMAARVEAQPFENTIAVILDGMESRLGRSRTGGPRT